MKILIKRHGIVIKSTSVAGDKASIGSGPDADVMIDDPYLGAHVADLVRRGGAWHIVDAGTSLDGVTRNGQRVDDEPLIEGETYAVGGFEIVVEGSGGPKPLHTIPGFMPATTVAPAAAPAASPGARDDEPLIPKTMYQPYESAKPASPPPPPIPVAVPQRSAPPPGFTPVAHVPRGADSEPRQPKNPRLRLILIAMCGAFAMLLLLILVVKGGSDKKKKNEDVARSDTASQPLPPPVKPVEKKLDAVREGERLLGDLRFDEALAAWEPMLASNAEVKRRYAEVALDLGRTYSAAGDYARAEQYFDKAKKAGASDVTP